MLASAKGNHSIKKLRPSPRGRRRPWGKLLIEHLEDRTLLATDIWTGASASSANWTDGNNWSRNGVPEAPVAGDDLVFPEGALQLTNTNNEASGFVVNSMTFSGTNYSITGSNPVNLAAGINITNAAPAGTDAYNGAITLTAAQTLDVALGLTFSNNGTLTNGGKTLTVAGAGNATLTGAISGTGGIEKGTGSGDTGTLTLNAANSYTGATTINAGVIATNSATGLGSATGGTVTVNSGATLNYTSAVTVAAGKTFVLNGPGFNDQGALEDSNVALTLNAPITIGSGTSVNVTGNTLTVGAVISSGGSGSLTEIGSGTLNLTASNTFTGSTIVSQGTLTLSGANGKLLNSSDFTVNPAATLRLDNSGTLVNNRIATTAPITLNGGNLAHVPNNTAANSNETFGNLILGPGSSTITSSNGTGTGVSTALGFGTLTRDPGATVDFIAASGTNAQNLGTSVNKISFAGTIPGQTTVTGGNIIPYATVTSLTSLGDFASNLGGGSIGAFSHYVTNINSSTSPLDVVKQTSSQTVSVSGQTIAALLLQPGAADTLTLSGTLTISTGAILSAPTGTFSQTIKGGTLDLEGPSDGVLMTNRSAAITTTIASTITAPNGVTFASYGAASTAALTSTTGNSGIADEVTLAGGMLSVAASGALGTGNLNLISGSLTATAATTLPNSFTIANSEFSGGITLGGTGALSINGPGTITGTNSLTLSDTGGVTFNGVIGETSPGSSLTVAGASPLTLNNANTFSGGVTLSGTNTVTVGNSLALGTGPLVVNGSGTTLQSGASTTLANPFTFGSGSGAITINMGAGSTTPLKFSGPGVLAASTVTIPVANTAGVYFNGALSGPASLTTNGAGTVFLTGDNSYAGGTTLSGNTLVAGTNTALGVGGLTLSSGTLVASAPLTLANLVTISGSTTITGTSFAGSGPTPLTFASPATLSASATLTVNNSTTFGGIVTGATGSTLTLAGLGTIVFGETNALGGPVVVNMSSGAFAGVGGVFGTVVVGSNNALGTGTLTLTGGAIQSGSSTGVTLANAVTMSAGTDTIALTGTNPLTFSGTVNNNGATTTFISTSGQTTTISGVLSGAGSLTLAGQGTLALTAANTSTAAVTVSGGTLALSGAGTLASTSYTINNTGTLRLDDSSSSTIPNRIVDTAAMTLSGGTIQLVGSASTTTTTETIGALTLASGQSTIALTPSGGNSTRLILASLVCCRKQCDRLLHRTRGRQSRRHPAWQGQQPDHLQGRADPDQRRDPLRHGPRLERNRACDLRGQRHHQLLRRGSELREIGRHPVGNRDRQPGAQRQRQRDGRWQHHGQLADDCGRHHAHDQAGLDPDGHQRRGPHHGRHDGARITGAARWSLVPATMPRSSSRPGRGRRSRSTLQD